MSNNNKPSIVEFAEDRFRGVGRTYIMIQGIKAALAEGHIVFVIGHTHQYAKELCREAGGGIPLALYDMPERLYGVATKTLVLTDHHAYSCIITGLRHAISDHKQEIKRLKQELKRGSYIHSLYQGRTSKKSRLFKLIDRLVARRKRNAK